MNKEEIKAKAATLAELYAAKAAGKTLQVKYDTGWANQIENVGPGMDSDLSRWRVKPEPRRMWEVEYTKSRTESEDTAKKWRAAGYTVTEWQEILSE